MGLFSEDPNVDEKELLQVLSSLMELIASVV